MTRGKDSIYKEMNKYLEELNKKMTEFDSEYSTRYTYGIYIYFAILINISINSITNKLSEFSLSDNSK